MPFTITSSVKWFRLGISFFFNFLCFVFGQDVSTLLFREILITHLAYLTLLSLYIAILWRIFLKDARLFLDYLIDFAILSINC